MASLGVRLPDNLDKRLRDLAKRTHRSKSHYVIEALEEYLIINEETLQTIAKYEEDKRNGRLKTVSLDEIKAQYDLD
ncbi:MAG: ribbon-helix-helix protein, CopG family [Candidatus Paracaedibacteraceae bacterium]|nr:ribbon-helix-helix protein, CopG family [Candidatus Paracaedibacteraceae bacterium]